LTDSSHCFVLSLYVRVFCRIHALQLSYQKINRISRISVHLHFVLLALPVSWHLCSYLLAYYFAELMDNIFSKYSAYWCNADLLDLVLLSGLLLVYHNNCRIYSYVKQHELVYFHKYLDPVINIIIHTFIVCDNFRQVLDNKKIILHNFLRKCQNIELGFLEVYIGARIAQAT
jgi:hypothetical protein